jgi:hypothetical protein
MSAHISLIKRNIAGFFPKLFDLQAQSFLICLFRVVHVFLGSVQIQAQLSDLLRIKLLR